MVGNKKLMIALFSICLVVIAGLLTTVIVLAAPSANVTSSINISYIASGIDGKLSAAYVQASTATSEEAGTKLKGGDDDSGEVTFSINDSGAKTGNFSLEDNTVTLTPTSKSIILIYTITSTGARGITATLKYDDDDAATDNFKVEYATDATQADSGWTAIDDEGTTTVNVEAGGSGTSAKSAKLYVRITLEDASQDATFVGSLIWALAPTAAA